MLTFAFVCLTNGQADRQFGARKLAIQLNRLLKAAAGKHRSRASSWWRRAVPSPSAHRPLFPSGVYAFLALPTPAAIPTPVRRPGRLASSEL
jgi:hypothetical protein